MPKLPEIQLPTNLRERLAQGHPWVYRNHIPAHVRFSTGDWLRVRCGNWQGYAIWDEVGPIALRIFSERQLPDPAWLLEQVQLAWELRAPLRASGCTAYRWLFGEGDGLPGLTVDRYGEYAIAQAYSAASATLLPYLADALMECDPTLRGVVRRVDDESEETSRRRIDVLAGSAPPRQLIVVEHGLRFAVDLAIGQKTGLFLDQRENRRMVETLSAGQRVLNCFAYTGGFSLYALRGGARMVTSVDSGKGLAEAASANIQLNQLAAQHHTFLTADCFDVLSNYVNHKQDFDLVILDPPSFAKSKQNRYAAIRAYTRLNTLGMQTVRPGGLLVTASCTSQVGPEAFREMLAAAASAADCHIQILHEAGQALDHPVPAHFPEGRYLKFLVARVLPVR
jgi:23S rRNA (cytosine1962-C5)-methyltransferase